MIKVKKFILEAIDILGQVGSVSNFRDVTKALRTNFGIFLASKHRNTYPHLEVFYH
jgi:hypothetical protein